MGCYWYCMRSILLMNMYYAIANLISVSVIASSFLFLQSKKLNMNKGYVTCKSSLLSSKSLIYNSGQQSNYLLRTTSSNSKTNPKSGLQVPFSISYLIRLFSFYLYLRSISEEMASLKVTVNLNLSSSSFSIFVPLKILI